MLIDGGAAVSIGLDDPPHVVQAGVGVHGVQSRTDVFRLPDLWQLHLYQYEGVLSLGGRSHDIRPGRVSLIPPATTVEFSYRGRSEHLYAHFRAASGVAVPVMQDAATAAPLLCGLLSEAVRERGSVAAHAAVWAALWKVANLPSDTGHLGHAAVRVAMDHIEWRLAEPMTVPQIADAAGISHNHLTRLFRAETGTSVVGYIRARRMGRAEHLLTETTVPIATVAATVGIPDLQAFNKICRRELGASPSRVRARGR
ncbi:AraC family transcriptional regulator [Stackebrandtia nassauensis]|uniref:Transcriptional regulator, AraC family n=1 Tax=Stackebrandtia nassauensis (strain DSM 44728 / CIP 108903 / NRRL B-16338 / NBRC 102104 / LLR-40K-21) TaxID=446470 RepID=D3Q9F4_STANL|nr:AraC family transcriptional regulator [Stackebrandtia nassauensis]ADD42636.1 transcriptional regulator, AraC family [Stackebrandtia nassauensis DSM 44728]